MWIGTATIAATIMMIAAGPIAAITATTTAAGVITTTMAIIGATATMIITTTAITTTITTITITKRERANRFGKAPQCGAFLFKDFRARNRRIMAALRNAARDIKAHTLAHLDLYLEAYEAKVLASGGKVHYAATTETATGIVLDICRRHGAKSVAKGKSMISA